jgi:hypothetical protein
MYWGVRKWIKSGGKLSKDNRWYELAKIKYKSTEKGAIQIMSKVLMRANGIPSPNIADALSLTFYDSETGIKMTDEEKFFYKKMLKNKMKSRPRGGMKLMSR